MTMEIVSETDYGRPENNFVPNYFVDITEYINHKINALKIYTTEIGEPPFPRSIENVMALATLRGGMSGVRYAEGFRLIKRLFNVYVYNIVQILSYKIFGCGEKTKFIC